MAKWGVAGKSFLITGGASGLGALYAEAFLNEGAKNVAIVDIAEDVGKATTARLNKSFPGKVAFFKCDVSSEEQIAATFDQVVAKFQQLDVLINNAGIMSDAPSLWRKACDVNWEGNFFEMTGIRVMTICLGVTDTPLLHGLKARSYNDKIGQEFEEVYEKIKETLPPQKPESAVVACVKLFKEGAPGSVWLPVHNKPVRDITPEIKSHFDAMTNLIYDA